MSIKKLEEIRDEYIKISGWMKTEINIGSFMIKTINIFKSQFEEIANLREKVKALEQAKTFFPMTESKHRALLNNCVDDDEAILHKREIDCPKDFTEKVMEKINKKGKR